MKGSWWWLWKLGVCWWKLGASRRPLTSVSGAHRHQPPHGSGTQTCLLVSMPLCKWSGLPEWESHRKGAGDLLVCNVVLRHLQAS